MSWGKTRMEGRWRRIEREVKKGLLLEERKRREEKEPGREAKEEWEEKKLVRVGAKSGLARAFGWVRIFGGDCAPSAVRARGEGIGRERGRGKAVSGRCRARGTLQVPFGHRPNQREPVTLGRQRRMPARGLTWLGRKTEKELTWYL